MNKLAMYILGAIAGGLLGGGIGLLLAPKPGRALREDISDYSTHVKNEVRLASQERRVELQEELARLRTPEPMSK